ncbi:hypothetical protein Tco_0370308 [Tanacetum coccineum]
MYNGGKAYRNLKNKSYEEIKDIYEKVKTFNDKFVTIGSTEDEQAIKEMNVKVEDLSRKKKVISAQDVDVMEQLHKVHITGMENGTMITVDVVVGVRALRTFSKKLIREGRVYRDIAVEVYRVPEEMIAHKAEGKDLAV